MGQLLQLGERERANVLSRDLGRHVARLRYVVKVAGTVRAEEVGDLPRRELEELGGQLKVVVGVAEALPLERAVGPRNVLAVLVELDAELLPQPEGRPPQGAGGRAARSGSPEGSLEPPGQELALVVAVRLDLLEVVGE